MPTMIDPSDTRTAKALAILADNGQWLKIRYADGRKAYGVPSQSRSKRDKGLYHVVTAQACDCEDFRRMRLPCKHVNAVRMLIAIVRAA